MIDKNNKIDQSYFWLNQPIYEIKNHRLYISTSPDTDFWQKEGLLKLKNHEGYSSFVFPHLCLAKSKVCPPINYFPKKEGL